METELQKINLQLNQLNKFISDLRSQEKATISRTESRISELQRIFKDDEDQTAGIKNDLLIIKRDLQFVRSNLKEILDHREHLDQKLKDFENRIDELEKEKFA